MPSPVVQLQVNHTEYFMLQMHIECGYQVHFKPILCPRDICTLLYKCLVYFIVTLLAEVVLFVMK